MSPVRRLGSERLSAASYLRAGSAAGARGLTKNACTALTKDRQQTEATRPRVLRGCSADSAGPPAADLGWFAELRTAYRHAIKPGRSPPHLQKAQHGEGAPCSGVLGTFRARQYAPLSGHSH